jgi:MFS family permease
MTRPRVRGASRSSASAWLFSPSTVRRYLADLHYGWIIVAALSVTETITWGVVYYGFPVFLSSMEGELHASRVAITGAFSVGLAVSALGAVPVGRWLDRRGPRLLMSLGSVLATALLFAWAHVQSVAALYAIWAFMGLAMAATLYEPAFAAIVQWFTSQRDRALLTLTLAAGLASTIFMPLEAWLLTRIGWRAAIQLLAVVVGATTIPIHVLVLRAPRDIASRSAEAVDAVESTPSVPLSVALGRLVFWVLALAFLVGNFATVSVTVHLIPYLGSYGYGAAFAAAVIGWMGAMQLLGRILFVPIASRLGSRAMAAAIFFAQAAGLLQLSLLAWLPSVLPVILLMGSANGMSTLARATMVSDIFGRRHYGSISGAIAMAANGARALGPVGASILYLALGTYERLFLALAGSMVLAGLAVLATPTDAETDRAA